MVSIVSILEMTNVLFAINLTTLMTKFQSALHHGSDLYTVYPMKYAQCVVIYFVVVMISSISGYMLSFHHIFQGCFTGIGTIIWLPQCQWSNPEVYV